MGCAAVAAVLVAGCSQGGAKRSGRPAASPNPVPTAAAKMTSIRASSSISGVISPYQNVAITSSLAEAALQVNVNEGDHVSAGQVIAVLDTSDLRAQLAAAQASVDQNTRNAASLDAKVAQARFTGRLNIDTAQNQASSAQAALQQARTTLQNDTLNLQRDKQLLSQGFIAQQTVDQQQTLVNNDASAVRTAEANLQTTQTTVAVNGSQTSGLQAANINAAIADARAAHAAIGAAQAQVQQIQTSIAKATIVSPVNGVVVNRNLNPGEYPGSRTIFTLQELDKVYAILNASSSDTFAIRPGAQVSLAIAGNAGASYTGTVAAVLGQVSPGSTNFTVKVTVNNADGKLQSGLPVTARINLPPVSGVGIPTTAFLDDTHTTIMVADDELVDVVAKVVHVHELGSDGTTSIVTGVKAGQQVVANGQLGLNDGQSLAQI